MALVKAVWTGAFVNRLPDASFLYIAPGGKKDADGRTVPRSLRYFPVKDADGKVDLPHLRNALARIPQANIPQAAKDKATATARRLLEEAKKMEKIEVSKFELMDGEEMMEAADKIMAALVRQKGKLKKSLFLRGIYNNHVIAKDRESGQLFRFDVKRDDSGGIELANMTQVRPAGFVPTKKQAPGDCVCPKCGTKVEHKAGEPCAAIKCPKCSTKMERKVTKADDFMACLVAVEGTVVQVPLPVDEVITLLKSIADVPDEVELTEKAESLWKDVLPIG